MTWQAPSDPSELIIEDFLGSALIIDFVIRSPYRLDRRIRKEVCDHVLEQKGDTIPIQLKTRKSTQTDPSRVEAWPKKYAAQAVRQLVGAARTLERQTVTYEHSRRGQGHVAPGMFRVRHGIALVENPTPGPLDLDLPLTAGDMAIHVMTPADLVNLSRELGSVADLRSYLTQRSKLPPPVRNILGIERSLCAWYLARGGELGRVSNLAEAEALANDLFAGQHSRHYLARRSEDVDLAYFNTMLNLVHWGDPSKAIRMEPGSSEQIVGVDAHREGEYLQIAYELNALPRALRVRIGSRLAGKASVADASPRPHFFVVLNDQEDVDLFFGASALRTDKSKSFLMNATHLALHRAKVERPAITRAIGVMVASRSRFDRGNDYCLIEDLGPPDGELVRRSAQIFGPVRMEETADLSSLLLKAGETRIHGARSDHELRETIRGRSFPRNSPCPCGSGVKYKKCHGRGS